MRLASLAVIAGQTPEGDQDHESSAREVHALRAELGWLRNPPAEEQNRVALAEVVDAHPAQLQVPLDLSHAAASGAASMTSCPGFVSKVRQRHRRARRDVWEPLERALDGMRVLSFEPRARHGRLETPLIAPTMGALARLGERLLDRLDLERAELVGYSFGGAMAQQFAIQSPERLRRLVVAASVPGRGGVPGRLTAMLTMGPPLRYCSRAFYEHTAGMVAGGRSRHDRPYVRRRGAIAPCISRQSVATRSSSGRCRSGRASRGCSGSRP